MSWRKLVFYRRAATYVDKILRGVKSADLRVEQPTRCELVVNLNTAKALGVRIRKRSAASPPPPAAC